MALPKPSCVRPEAQSLPPLVRAAWSAKSALFSFGSVVRRTEPHVRYLFVAYTWFVSFFCVCVTADFSIRVRCASQRSRQVKLSCKKARPSGPPGGASLLVNRSSVRPRYAGPNGEPREPANQCLAKASVREHIRAYI